MNAVVSSAAEIFNEQFDKIEKVIPYDLMWGNGTGYYDYAVGYRQRDGVTPVALNPGELAKSVSLQPNNRKLIFMGTPIGPIVVFERYTAGKDGVIVFNAAPKLDRLKLVLHNQLTADDLGLIFGWIGFDNLGTRLADAFPALK